jgi:signal transduction histidine kinase/ActR/RegA family two-component response regulator
VQAVWARALAGEEFLHIGEIRVGRETRHYEMRFQALRDESGRVVGASQFMNDVTARLREQARLRDAEAALTQSQKMEAVGQLTGGIAHDFNNLLSAIVGNFELIKARPDEKAWVQRFAQSGLQVAERGAKLTGQLLAFSRSQRIELQALNVAELVGGMRDMLTRTLGPMIRLQFELDTGDLAVLSDATQLEMAVLNLAINARDAMPGGGTLTLRSAVRELSGEAGLAPGTYIEISVADTGVGMSADVLAHAFDPFFTTKGVGQGTGLGLSQVYAIACQGGGTARIDSEPGQGTTVRLLLPATGRPRPREEQAAAEPETVPARQRARVLIVDDDRDIREVIRALLEGLGYDVREAADGASCLAQLEAFDPQLLLVDFAMPGMSGAELARLVRASRPSLPIVFASGYADTAAIEDVPGATCPMLRKPFAIDELQRVLAEALQGCD